ncbi:hypothetical protein DFAR_3500002 [Desulfarculales bacterium]
MRSAVATSLLQPHQAVALHLLEWVRLYRQGGGKLKSLYPMGKNDRGGSRALDEDTAQALVRLRRGLLTASVTTLISEMMRRRLTSLDLILKAPTVYRFLHQQGLMGKQIYSPVDLRRFEAELPNDIWRSDAIQRPMLLVDDKRCKTYLFAFIDGRSRLTAHAEFYFSEGLATYLQALALRQPCSNGGYHAGSTSTTVPPSAPTTWKKSPPPWATPWSVHRPTCPRVGVRSKNSSARSGSSFSLASRTTPFGTSIRPWSAGLGTSTTSASIWAPDKPSCNVSPARGNASDQPTPIWKTTSEKEPRAVCPWAAPSPWPAGYTRPQCL